MAVGGATGARLPRWIAGLLLAIAVACQPLPDATPMGREATLGPAVSVRHADFEAALSGPVETRFGSGDAAHVLRVALPDSRPIECSLRRGEARFAVDVDRETERLLDALRGDGHAITHRSIYGVRAGAIGGTPYLWVATEFVRTRGEERAWGLVKVASAETAGFVVLCSHAEAGFVASFDRVFEELVGSLRSLEPRVEPIFRQICTTRFGALDVSFASAEVHREGDGSFVLRAVSSEAFPLTRDQLDSYFSRRVERSDAAGILASSRLVFWSDGTRKQDLTLDREEGRWRVRGRFEDAEVDRFLDHDGPIHGRLHHLVALRHRLLPHQPHLVVEHVFWRPSPRRTLSDHIGSGAPARIETDWTRVDNEAPYDQLGRKSWYDGRIRRDQRGFADAGELTVGPVALTVTCVHREGDLEKPPDLRR
ncbi:MAG: hypothetical protein AAF430_06470 [Myxococcota bacterium]